MTLPAPGTVYELGTLSLSESEITDFARQFDPQPFHLDPQAARESIFGTLIASGLHTLSACFGHQVRSRVFGDLNLGGRGIERLDWRRAVRPDVAYALTLEILRVEPDPKRGRADVAVAYRLRDPAGALVMDAVLVHLMRL